MSRFIIALSLLSVSAYGSPINKNAFLFHVPTVVLELMKKLGEECIKEEGVDHQILVDFFNVKTSPDLPTKKFIYCFCTKLNYTDEDGRLNDSFLTLFDGNDSNNLKAEAQKVIEECNVKQDNKYDTAYETVDCFYSKSPIVPVP